MASRRDQETLSVVQFIDIARRICNDVKAYSSGSEEEVVTHARESAKRLRLNRNRIIQLINTQREPEADDRFMQFWNGRWRSLGGTENIPIELLAFINENESVVARNELKRSEFLLAANIIMDEVRSGRFPTDNSKRFLLGKLNAFSEEDFNETYRPWFRGNALGRAVELLLHSRERATNRAVRNENRDINRILAGISRDHPNWFASVRRRRMSKVENDARIFWYMQWEMLKGDDVTSLTSDEVESILGYGIDVTPISDEQYGSTTNSDDSNDSTQPNGHTLSDGGATVDVDGNTLNTHGQEPAQYWETEAGVSRAQSSDDYLQLGAPHTLMSDHDDESDQGEDSDSGPTSSVQRRWRGKKYYYVWWLMPNHQSYEELVRQPHMYPRNRGKLLARYAENATKDIAEGIAGIKHESSIYGYYLGAMGIRRRHQEWTDVVPRPNISEDIINSALRMAGTNEGPIIVLGAARAKSWDWRLKEIRGLTNGAKMQFDVTKLEWKWTLWLGGNVQNGRIRVRVVTPELFERFGAQPSTLMDENFATSHPDDAAGLISGATISFRVDGRNGRRTITGEEDESLYVLTDMPMNAQIEVLARRRGYRRPRQRNPEGPIILSRDNHDRFAIIVMEESGGNRTQRPASDGSNMSHESAIHTLESAGNDGANPTLAWIFGDGFNAIARLRYELTEDYSSEVYLRRIFNVATGEIVNQEGVDLFVYIFEVLTYVGYSVEEPDIRADQIDTFNATTMQQIYDDVWNDGALKNYYAAMINQAQSRSENLQEIGGRHLDDILRNYARLVQILHPNRG